MYPNNSNKKAGAAPPKANARGDEPSQVTDKACVRRWRQDTTPRSLRRVRLKFY